MLEKLQSISERYDYLNEVLGTEDIFSNQNRYREVSKEHSDIAPIVQTYQKYLKVINELAETEKLSKESEDRELREIAAEEAGELQAQKEKLEKELRVLLSPIDPADDKNAIMEIRAGTGGMEAALFAADLYKMYSRFIERMGWKLEDLSVSGSDVGGFKEIIFLVKGKNAYGRLKFEGGVHRVQRVPATEASGRIHTSAASVVVLPEAEEVEINIEPNDLQIDVFRATGPGGQSVNTTDSAVRITHKPSGLVVTCQDEKSQHKNKAKAMKVLRSRLLDKIKSEEMEKTVGERRLQVGTGDRSVKIRTYNFPEKRVTDHRINLTLYKLDSILQGSIDEILEKLKIADQTDNLASK
ncbi:peptide chain release factor 1 [candidate division KSB1 bacterium]|nr:peptide chain release factor 1 [candidate division KSB1 bacterium]